MDTATVFKREDAPALRRPTVSDGDLKCVALLPDAVDALARRQGREFEAQNEGLFQAQATVTNLDERIDALKADLRRLERHRAECSLGEWVLSKDAVQTPSLSQRVGALLGIGISAAALIAGNVVGAAYVLASGSDLFSGQPWLANTVMALPALGGLALKFQEGKLRSDRTRERFAKVMFVLAAGATLVWMAAATWFFAPEAGESVDWLATGPSPLDHTLGALLVFAHLLADAACGFVVLSGAASVMQSGRRKVFIPNAMLQELTIERDRLLDEIEKHAQIRARNEDFLRRFDEARLATEDDVRSRANGARLMLDQSRRYAAASADSTFLN